MKTADKEKLWDAYRQKKTQETREQLIIEYAPVSYTHLRAHET